jgi:hypothetical protein
MGQSEHRRGSTPQLRRLVEVMVHNCQDPVRLLELYYWSSEPGALPIIRGFALMPSKTRAALEAFIRDADPHSISAGKEASGRLRLTSKRRSRLRREPAKEMLVPSFAS